MRRNGQAKSERSFEEFVLTVHRIPLEHVWCLGPVRSFPAIPCEPAAPIAISFAICL
jgi:hypothetical protein